ncbi:MAG: thioredoxin domain-containing protein [Gemmataceae bacterium]|nr:thioredoxin domain-containing protein [Gemmataceae bacterium]
MPAAVLLGALAVAGAIWVTRGDESQPTPAQGDLSAAGSRLQTPAAQSSPSPAATQDLRAVFAGYARQVGLDLDRYQQCLSRPENLQLIQRQFQRGVALGVDGTPTFVINNKMVVGALPAAVFDEIITAELNGSPTSLDAYSNNIRQLAATNPPRFKILDGPVDVSDAAVEGSRSARVVVAEFSDFQCPFCKRWTDDTLKGIRTRFGADVALAFLHFPIAQIHPNAANAALVAVCAADQGKFWPMHDLLFARQAEWQSLKAGS